MAKGKHNFLHCNARLQVIRCLKFCNMTICSSVSRSKFCGDLSPPSPVIYAHDWGCNGRTLFWVTAANSRRSAWSQRAATVGMEWAQYPYLMAWRIKASTLFRSAEFANPHQTGAAYVSSASAVDWIIACNAGGGIPWLWTLRSAWRSRAQFAITLAYWRG